MLSIFLYAFAATQDPKFQDELEKLEERVDKKLQELDRKLEEVNRAAAKNAFNPQITVFGNFAARSDSRAVIVETEGGDMVRVDDRAFFRAGEVDFRAAIDPYADGVIIIAVEGTPDGEFETHLEEGYALLKRIPILEADGVKLKLGKFRPAFGISNKLHLHDMPHVTRPLVIARYLGSEHGEFFEAGFAPMGAEANFFVPGLGDDITVDVFIAVLSSGEIALTEENEARKAAWLGHVDFFVRLGPGSTLNLGASHYVENGRFSSRLSGVDVTFVWRPDAFRSIVAGGEILFADREFDDGGPMRTKPVGWYAYAQAQLSANLYVGVRHDSVRDPDDDDGDRIKALGVYVSYYTSEFFRIRVGFERRNRIDFGEDDDLNTFMVEINLVFGSHPVEPYWVNR
jgi:hypothetical protein